MTDRITERDLILPTLYCINHAENKALDTGTLIKQLRELLQPTGEDLEILENRVDDKFSQKVRNLKSHNTLEKLGLAEYTGGNWRITVQGEAYLIDRQDEIDRILEYGKKGIESTSLQEEIEESLAEKTGVAYEDEEAKIIKPFDPTKIRIISRTLTIHLAMRRISEHEIILDPDFQRAAGIWKNAQQSRLVESILLRIPLPAFYLDATDDDKWIVIDGLQRLTTLQRFVVDQELVLDKLEFLKEYNGYTFSKLPRNLQRRIEETELTVYLVERGTPTDVKLNIFKRINTHGTPLSSQEIRHALNLGPATKLLQELAESESFKLATNYSISPLRMADRECILRFLAFTLRGYDNYFSKDDLDTFLVESMKTINQMGETFPENLDELREKFYRAMKAAIQLFGNAAFRKNERAPISKALFETWSVNLSRLDNDQVQHLIDNRQELINKFKLLMMNTDFVSAISYSTGDANKIYARFHAINNIIEEIIS